MVIKNRWWVVVASACGLFVGNGPIMQFTFGVFLLPLTKEFGWSRSETSLALVIGLTLTGIFSPVFGRLVDRFGIRTVTLPLIVLFAASLASLGYLATTPTRFVVLYGIMGIFAAGQSPLPYAKAIAAWFDDKRGRALGIAMAGVGLGAALVPQFAQKLVSTVGWRDAYVGLALLVLVVGITAVGLAVKEPEAGSRQRQSEALPGLTTRESLRTSAFWKMAVAFMLVGFATNGIIAHVVPMLVDRGVPAPVAATALAAAGLSLIGGRLLAGFALDRIFGAYVAGFFFLVPLVGIGIFLSNAVSASSGAVAVVTIGLGLGAEVDLIAFLLSRYLGLKSFGELYGYMFAAFMLGSGSGPYVMGLVFDKTGNYTAAVMGMGGLLIVATLLTVSLGRYVFAPKTKTAPSPETPLATAPAH